MLSDVLKLPNIVRQRLTVLAADLVEFLQV